MFENLRADLRRSMSGNSHRSGLRGLIAELAVPGTQAIIVYRFGRWVETRVHLPVIRQLLLFLHAFPQYFVRALIGVNIPRTADIGPGLVIHTWTGINLGSVKAGKNLTLLHGITVDYDCREIGDDVLIGAGAKIIRKVKIGSGVRIGANAVVMTDLPDNCIAVGIPARVIIPGKAADPDSAGEASVSENGSIADVPAL